MDDLTPSEWSTIRVGLAVYYQTVVRNLRRAQKSKNPSHRPSELAMEAADVKQLWDKLRASQLNQPATEDKP